VKSTHSHQRRNGPLHSLITPALAASARITEPAKTVLVVDDDAMVRDMETQVLRLQGYTVLEAESAAEALRLAAATATIDLLVTDLMMPETDGLELTRRFRVVHPQTPVLMVSGSLPLLRARCAQDLDRFDFLAKPFHLDELIHKARTLMDATDPLQRRKSWCCD
jgi:DNA-binding NtrC family response regulator